jgi:PEGA domain
MNHTNLRLLAVCGALAAPALASFPALAQQPAPAPPGAAPTAAAASPPPASPPPGAAPSAGPAIDGDTLARQRDLFDRGNKFYDQKNYADAEFAYLGAWKLKKSFDVAGNLGNLEFDLKKWRAAAEFLSFAIRAFPAGGKPGLRDALLKSLEEAQKQVGQLHVRVNRPGAEVFVDGVSIGLAPLADEVYVEPGTHLIEGRLEGFPPAQVTISATKGQSADVTMTLAVKGANKKVLVAGGVIAGVAAITGGVFTGLSFSEASTAKSKYTAQLKTGCPAAPPSTGACGDLKAALDSKNLFANVALYSFVAAGAVGIATTVYGLVGGARASRTGLVVAPVMTAQGGGLFVNGSF